MSETLYPDCVIRTGEHVVTAMSFFHSPDDGKSKEFLVTGTDAGHVIIWKLSTQCLVQDIDLESNTVLSILNHSNTIIVYTRKQKVTILHWSEMDSLFLVKTATQPTESLCPTFCAADLCCLNDSPTISYLAIPSDKSVQLYSIDTVSADVRELENMRLCTKAMVTCIKAFEICDSPGVNVLVGTEAGAVNLFKFNNVSVADESELAGWSCKELSTLNTHGEEPVLTLDYLPTSQLGASAGASGKISVWKCVNCKLISNVNIDTPSRGFNSVRLRSDGKLLIACAWEGVVRLYSLKKARCLAILDFHRESVTAVTFNINNRFVTSSKDKSMCLWSLYAAG